MSVQPIEDDQNMPKIIPAEEIKPMKSESSSEHSLRDSNQINLSPKRRSIFSIEEQLHKTPATMDHGSVGQSYSKI